MLCQPVLEQEIKEAVFSLRRNEVPSPNGFTVEFFTHGWDIIGPDLVDAMPDFFRNSHLLIEVNSTIITLVPKVRVPIAQKDYRQISYCNMIYKTITKILANRLKKILPEIISSEQSAFISGRRIADNILLAHELAHNYQSRKCSPQRMLKIDLMKAFDTVNWDFLRGIIDLFSFPAWIIDRIMFCITSVKFSLNMNGELVGYFPASKGLRQGDLLSLLLFTLVIEAWTWLLRVGVATPGFRFH